MGGIIGKYSGRSYPQLKSTLTITAWTADLGDVWNSPEEFALAVTDRVLVSWSEGADVVLLPEFLWLGLEQFSSGLEEVSSLFWGTLWPEISSLLNQPGKCVVLGTVPFADGSDGMGLLNRTVIISGGVVLFQSH